MKQGSDKGRALLKQRLKSLISMVPDDYIMAAAVDYVCQLILHSKGVMKQKLSYIRMHELDVDCAQREETVKALLTPGDVFHECTIERRHLLGIPVACSDDNTFLTSHLGRLF